MVIVSLVACVYSALIRGIRDTHVYYSSETRHSGGVCIASRIRVFDSLQPARAALALLTGLQLFSLADRQVPFDLNEAIGKRV